MKFVNDDLKSKNKCMDTLALAEIYDELLLAKSKPGVPGRYLIPEFKKTSDLLHRQQTKKKTGKFAQTFIVFSFLLEISFNSIPSPFLKDAWKFHNKFTNCLSSPRPLPRR
jgi:hypothetical protein